jgi:hypothetical protein
LTIATSICNECLVVRRAILVIALLGLAASAAASDSVLRFGPARVVATVSGVGGLSEQEMGDINGDGVSDIVVTRLAFPIAHASFPIGIFLGNGRGGFADGSSMFTGPVPRTQHGRQIVIADFNGDRRNDIFVADHGYDAEPFPGQPNTLVLSTPDGRLADASSNLPPSSGFSHSAAAADVDRDGDVDLYVGNLCCGDGTPPELLLNDGAGRFTRSSGRLPAAQADPSQSRYTRSLFVDANRDGAPDLVLGAENNTPLSVVLLNDGTGHFHGAPRALPPKAFGPTAITIALAALDVDRDGKADLIAGFQRADFTGRLLQVLMGNGDGTFRDETAARLPSQNEGPAWPYAIRVADVNRDGHLDFGVALSLGPQSEHPPLYLADGAGGFRVSILSGSGPLFSFADADRDGRPDILNSISGGTAGLERHELLLQIARPRAPIGVTASRAYRDRIQVGWRPVPGATRYETWRAPVRSGRRVVIGTSAGTRFNDRYARRGFSYRYWVRAMNSAGTGAFSSPTVGRRS